VRARARTSAGEDARYEENTKSSAGSLVLFPVCFASLEACGYMRIPALITAADTPRRVHRAKTRPTADAVIAILAMIAGLRQTRNLHYDDSSVKNKIHESDAVRYE